MRFLPLFAIIYALTPLAIDMYLPALPEIAQGFNTGIEAIQNSLSIYLGGYAFGMFLFGPLADRFGRRPLLLFGLTGFSLFSILLAFAANVEQFLFLRFFQALTGAAATVVIPGTIRQLFGKDTAKGLSYVSMIMMIAPMLAPAFGSYLLALEAWPLIFKFLCVYSLILGVIAYKFFPKIDENLGNQVHFLGRYKEVLSDSYSHIYLVISIVTSLMFFTYLTSVSFLYMEVFKFTPAEFSFFFGCNVFGLMSFSFFNTRLVPKFGSERILSGSIIFCAIFAMIFFSLIAMNVSPYLIVASLVIILGNCIVISANSDALILQRFPKQAATATAVIGSLRFGFGALAGPLLAFFFNDSAMPIATIVLVCGILLCFMELINIKRKKRSLALQV